MTGTGPEAARAPGGIVGWLERIGGVLVSPRAAIAESAARDKGHGLGDLGAILLLRLACGDTPTVVRGVLRVRALGAGVAVATLGQAAQRLVPDLVAVVILGLSLALAARVGGGPREANRAGGADPLDLAAYAWVPYSAVQLAAAVAVALAGASPGLRLARAVDAVGAAWALAVWTLALLVLRARRAERPS